MWHQQLEARNDENNEANNAEGNNYNNRGPAQPNGMSMFGHGHGHGH